MYVIDSSYIILVVPKRPTATSHIIGMVFISNVSDDKTAFSLVFDLGTENELKDKGHKLKPLTI